MIKIVQHQCSLVYTQNKFHQLSVYHYYKLPHTFKKLSFINIDIVDTVAGRSQEHFCLHHILNMPD